MKRAFSRSLFFAVAAAGLFVGLLTGSALAATDFWSAAPGVGSPDTLDDVWQSLFNGWGLSAAGDEDKDGCSNYVESMAGTDPRNPSDCIKVGNMVITAGNILFTFKAEAGKKYRVMSDVTPGGSFATVVSHLEPVIGAEFFVPATDSASQVIKVAKAAGTRMFYRLEVTDADTDSDGVSDWAERKSGLNPMVSTDSNNDGIKDDLAEITAEVAVPDVVSIVASESEASEDGPQSGTFTLNRTRSLIPATVNFSLSGTASTPGDYAAPSTTMSFMAGEKSKQIFVNPSTDNAVEGSESVTATLTTTSAGIYVPPVIDQAKKVATVIIGNSTEVSGTGLTARYYDHSNATYAHAANFGDAGNYVYTRVGTTPNFTGTTVVTPTGLSTQRLSDVLAAVTVGGQVKLSFGGGNLNTATYNHINYTVASKNATSFTCTMPPGAALPATSNSSCNFSILPLHPAVINRVDATVNNDWIYGTVNAAGTAAPAGSILSNIPDNYSDTFETFLQPTTAGIYRFQLDADDRARVLLDLNNNGAFELPGEQIVEHGWDDAGTVTPEDGVADAEVIGTFKISGSYALTVPTSSAFRLKMRVEHVETSSTARCRLQWSRDGGTFGNIPQGEQFTHTQGAAYAFARASATAGTATITLTSHGLSNGNSVKLAFSGSNLFTPNSSDLNGYSGSYTVANATANTFDVAITGTNLPAAVGAGQACFLEDRPLSTTTGVFNKIYSTTNFTLTPTRVGTFQHVTEQNNGVWGVGTPDVALINPDTFSVRWSGQVQPQFTEEYTFIVQADDGCTLRLNGQVQEMKTLPGTNNDGSNYHYDNTTGTILVNYANARIKAGSFVAGETIRIDPSSGNLNQTTANTYTYDATTGVATVNYSAQTTVTPGGYAAGQFVELDPTAGTAAALGNLRYTILASPAPTSNTFAVDFGINAFSSQTAGAAINVTDNRDIVVASVFPAGNATYTYTSSTGATVVDYSAAGLPANTITKDMSVMLDPTGGNLTNEIYTSKTVTAHTASTFTVSYTTGSGDSTNSMLFMVPSLTSFPASQTTGMALVHYAGRNANNSVGSINLDIVNKPLKDWASMVNERYVRLPVVGGTRYDIQLDYYESSGNARAQLYWMSASQPKQIIPAERLYPESVPQAPPAHIADMTATALVGGPFSYAVLGSNGGAVSVSGLPAGLSYLNGIISGNATTAGDYQILISIANATGTSTSVLNLHVEAAGGNVAREVWTGIAGTSISSIPMSTAPSSTSNLSSLQSPVDAADNFGARMRGYITAPTTGNYYFWLNASDSAEFWLSNDDETINSFKRATVTGGVSAKSPWMALEQGKRYYFEILHKAGAGSDNLSLGWSKPGESTTTASEVVPGYVITNYVPPAPGSTPGTLYIATMLSQNGAITNGVGTATLRLSEDETVAYVTFNHSGLTGPLTDWHVHNDPFLTAPAGIIFDGVEPVTPGDGLVLTGPNAGSHKWTILGVGSLSAANIRELIKQGKSYINLHTTAYVNGEIRGNYTLAVGSRTFTPPPAPPAWTDDSNTDAGAARFLTQASFGPNIADLAALKALTATSSSGQYPPSRYETWIDAQFGQVASQTLPEVLRTRRADAQGGSQLDEALFFNAWWRNSISNADQLRQRIAFALSEIHVISGQGPLDNRGDALAFFYDKLNEASFGNFRDILETTTLTPAMGRYLDMRNNDKPDITVGRIPNENYAREIKQLFSVGLYRHWPDGTLMLTSKDTPIDTYTQREIVGFAHVFTGWTDGYDGAYRTGLNAPANWMRLMREVPARHYTGPKRVMNNEVFPGLPTLGGQVLDPLATHNSTHFNQAAYEQLAGQELELSHQQLFDHPNTGPFICRQLIQRLVTSHPSRDYLYRVVQKFDNRGDGVRGDMQAVIKAILLDYEARSPDMITKPAFGKQREPVLRVAAAGRAFRPGTFAGTYTQTGTRTITIDLTPAGTAHKLASGNNTLLEFTPTNGVAPWTGTYGITNVDTDTFTIQATNHATGTYSIPANSTVCTVSMTSHWLQSGNQVFMDFTSGPADATAIDGQVYTITHSETANNGDNGNAFTIPVVGTSASARTGNCMIPRFRPGSMTIATSGLAAPNDRRVTMRTEEDHHLQVGNQVQLNIYGIQILPQPADLIVTVDTVVDLKTYTFLISSATSGWNTTQGNNSVYQFPLISQPLNRSGTIQSRSSTYQLGNTDGTLEQSPVNADTVFNYFLPEYKFPGALASQGITTPEFQLTAETTTVRQANFFYDGIFNPGTTNGWSSFSSGNNAVSMDYSNWITGNAGTNLGLGAASTTTVPWTHNQNIVQLVDHMSVLLTSNQLSTATKSRIRNFVSQPIASITTGNPCTVNTNGPHGYATGQSVCISGVAGGTFSASVNSNSTARVITVVDADTFTMTGVNCTVAPSAANLTDAHASQVVYNQGTTTPSATERRDRFRAILHLILTSPDFTIQR